MAQEEIKEEAVSEEETKTVETSVKAKVKKEKAPKLSPRKQSTLVRYAVLGGIVILINLFAVYALQVAYPEPLYENFCKVEQVKQSFANEEECVGNGGQWNASVGQGETLSSAYCNADFTCSKDHQQAYSLYSRNVFIVFVALGLFLLAGSLFIPGSTLVSSGLSFAGILALIIGSLGYWSDMNDILRLVILGVALVTVLYLAWKKFED
jgi:small-conductance mechanosensitive channel